MKHRFLVTIEWGEGLDLDHTSEKIRKDLGSHGLSARVAPFEGALPKVPRGFFKTASAKAFFEKCEPTEKNFESTGIRMVDFHGHYQKWCDTHGYDICGPSNFWKIGHAVREGQFDVRRIFCRRKKNVCRVLTGLLPPVNFPRDLMGIGGGPDNRKRENNHARKKPVRDFESGGRCDGGGDQESLSGDLENLPSGQRRG